MYGIRGLTPSHPFQSIKLKKVKQNDATLFKNDVTVGNQ